MRVNCQLTVLRSLKEELDGVRHQGLFSQIEHLLEEPIALLKPVVEAEVALGELKVTAELIAIHDAKAHEVARCEAVEATPDTSRSSRLIWLVSPSV